MGSFSLVLNVRNTQPILDFILEAFSLMYFKNDPSFDMLTPRSVKESFSSMGDPLSDR